MRNRTAVKAEGIALGILALLSYLNEVLPVISFEWRLACLIFFIVVAGDFCLRLPIKSQYARVFLSLGVVLLITASLWNPMRAQYMKEHLEPSLPFLMGGPLGDNNSPVWVVMSQHYGPEPVFNCDVHFLDEDRSNINKKWLEAHPTYPSPYAPKDVVGESRVDHNIPEADPFIDKGGGAIRWVPLNPDHQHYTTTISCRDGEYVEWWEVSRINGKLLTFIVVERTQPWLEAHPDLRRSVFSCVDPGFSHFPLLDHVPGGVNPLDDRSDISGRYQFGRAYDPPVMVVDQNNNHFVYESPKPLGCWELLERHIGDARMPLSLPSNPMAEVFVFYGVTVLLGPLFCAIGFWRVDDLDKNTKSGFHRRAKSRRELRDAGKSSI